MNGSTAPAVPACIAPPLAAAMISSWASTTLPEPGGAPGSIGMIVGMRVFPCSGRGLRRKSGMNNGTLACQRGRLHDLIIPFHGNRLARLVHQNFQEGEK